MTDIYFIRHGETGGNVAKRHQQENTHLTERGKAQAHVAAATVAQYEPTHLFVSHRVRALETGQAVAAATDLTPEVTDLFTEICRPANMYGHRHASVKTGWYLWQWWRGKVGGNDCGVEGESYDAFRERLQKAKGFLEALPPDARVVIVSHSVFISLFLAHLHTDRRLSLLQAARTFYKIKHLPNGSIAHVCYTNSTWTVR